MIFIHFARLKYAINYFYSIIIFKSFKLKSELKNFLNMNDEQIY
jgi:hypothetical protein